MTNFCFEKRRAGIGAPLAGHPGVASVIPREATLPRNPFDSGEDLPVTHSLPRCLALAAALLLNAAPAVAQTSFVAFESGPVRPLALSPDGSQLFAVNTPDNRLEVFDVVVGGLVHADSIPVGMEPVAVAARTNSEVWVVNHLSDSISIVNDDRVSPSVRRTLRCRSSRSCQVSLSTSMKASPQPVCASPLVESLIKPKRAAISVKVPSPSFRYNTFGPKLLR